MKHKINYKQVAIGSCIVLATFNSPTGFTNEDVIEECRVTSSNNFDRLWELVQTGFRTLASEALCQKQYVSTQHRIEADNIYLQTDQSDNKFRTYVTAGSSTESESITQQSLQPTEATFTIIENRPNRPIIDTLPGYKSSK